MEVTLKPPTILGVASWHSTAKKLTRTTEAAKKNFTTAQ
jgi:hypothetical protein